LARQASYCSGPLGLCDVEQGGTDWRTGRHVTKGMCPAYDLGVLL